MKLFLISLVILGVLWCILKVMYANMNKSELVGATLLNEWPKRILVVTSIFLLSAIETIIALIRWILIM